MYAFGGLIPSWIMEPTQYVLLSYKQGFDYSKQETTEVHEYLSARIIQ